MQILATDRLILGQLMLDDTDDLYQIFSDPEAIWEKTQSRNTQSSVLNVP